MAKKTYPFILILDTSLELIHSPSELESALFYASSSTYSEALCLFENGQCESLNQVIKAPPSMERLTQLTQEALSQNGQCCVGKISITSYQQIFQLLTDI